MNRSNSTHDDVQYHRMTAQNDGFVDMQVLYKTYVSSIEKTETFF